MVYVQDFLTFLSPKSDQHQFSPNKINTSSMGKVMRIDNMIIKGYKCFDLLSNSFNQFFRKMYGDQSGEFVCGCWWLKG